MLNKFPISLLPCEVINHLAQALMFVEVIKSVEFHVLDDLIEAICDLMEKLNNAPYSVINTANFWREFPGLFRILERC